LLIQGRYLENAIFLSRSLNRLLLLIFSQTFGLKTNQKKGAVPKPVSALAVFRRRRCLPYEKLLGAIPMPLTTHGKGERFHARCLL